MKSIILSVIIAISVISTVSSYPADGPAEIVLLESDVSDDGYDFKYETSDGIARTENGKLKETGDEEGRHLSVSGVYTFSDDKGKSHTVKYIADENGYRVLPGSS